MAAFEVHFQGQGRGPEKFSEKFPDGSFKVIDGGVLEVTHPDGGKTLFSPARWATVTAEPRRTASPLSGIPE
jgi:hypothetical protein